MDTTVEDVTHENGVNLHVVPSKKFKTVTITAKLKAPLSRDTITKRALLPYVLQQGTKSFPSRSDIQLKLDSLYGAVLSMGGGKKGNNHILSIRMEVANQKFISNESAILEEAMALLNEVIFHPYSENGAFKQSIIDREKDTLRQKMSAIIDDKMSYANMKLIDEMCDDELYKLHVHGYKEDLDLITPENLFAYYQTVLREDQLDIYVLGDFDSATVKEKIRSTFHRNENRVAPNEKKETIKELKKQPNVVIEEQDIQQAKLHFGYRTHSTYQDDDYFALQVFNGLFGGFPSSKLFINVREKNSLAYYAASRFESHKGLLFVFSGIAPNDYEKAREIIELQMDAMKNGDFSAEEMDNTKELIINQLLETMDNTQGMIELLYQQVVAGTERPPQTLIDGIKQVTTENVIEVANKIELDTIYLLTGKGGESDE
ncbi:EF-P 5-aminopentanol modification-associated protein YfmF [Virgibacillus litoralis]|uniref:Zn-dependent peptidase n=1 Tax=Virgibacillus litoralis TaxID=578221 RepID=A0ABS4HEN0_9BACI|nr:pitrilysin family protein [Virgibacillus litoralis]MBP1949189.1 putative Zn-dependent peptidase [Virgibacillus litoralis]